MSPEFPFGLCLSSPDVCLLGFLVTLHSSEPSYKEKQLPSYGKFEGFSLDRVSRGAPRESCHQRCLIGGVPWVIVHAYNRRNDSFWPCYAYWSMDLPNSCSGRVNWESFSFTELHSIVVWFLQCAIKGILVLLCFAREEQSQLDSSLLWSNSWIN